MEIGSGDICTVPLKQVRAAMNESVVEYRVCQV
jgi:hypothetical protein